MFNTHRGEGFPEREKRILGLWEKEKTFLRSLEQRKDNALFSFYDGPPFATGLPHYGHLLAGTLKDVIPRYKTMRGYSVPRRFGWDCHGLPIENEIEKAYELSGASSIENFGIANFNEECRKIVLRYTNEWKRIVDRMGRWVDFSATYHTMDPTFMESVWWVFKTLYEKGLIYEGFKVMPFSAKLGTPLSNFEANLNYQEVDDPSLTVAFPLEDQEGTFLLIWTTTPWTLISNLAVIVGAHIDYVKVKSLKDGKNYILAKARLSQYFKEENGFEVLSTFKGLELKDRRYTPPFAYFIDRKQEGAFRVVLDEFVSVEDGTGLVHAAPAFGEIDFFVCKREGIELVCPVDSNGRFTDEIPEYRNILVKDADREIIKQLKREEKVFHHGQIRHRYPYCWRSDTPLIYKAVQTWFVSVESLKARMLHQNEKIHWVPPHIKRGRFGKWLENARDWAISRNRYWGTPIPIWRSPDGEVCVIGSVQELEGLTGKKITDLHRHHIDQLTFSKNGKIFHRIPEVFDCWFESGSMPYAQNHYPFKNEEGLEQAFPADFIAEGLDQTRGWFYTLHVLATALFDKPAFKNVIVNGIILAEDGNKMSKRLKNYPDPMELVERYGADSVRLYMLSSPAMKAEDLKFSERGVELTLRQLLIPFWNSYSFFATYASIYKWKPTFLKTRPVHQLDRWILSLLQKLIAEVEASLEVYDLPAAVEPLLGFIEQLTNWYIRRSRSRFWSDQDSQDRQEAFATLYSVLLELSQISAPFIPFISDAIYRELHWGSMKPSVHLTDYPRYREEMRDLELEKEMQLAQTIASLGHSLRKEQKIRVRQPLAKAFVISADEDAMALLRKQQELIAEELNVKEVVFEKEEQVFITYLIKPNFKLLGKKLGSRLPQVQSLLAKMGKKEVEGKESVILNVDGEAIELNSEEILIEKRVREGIIAASEGRVAIALDTELSESLIAEGFAREIVNKLNTMRKEADFAVTDRIRVAIETTPKVQAAFEEHRDYICGETLAVDVKFISCNGQEWDLLGEFAKIAIDVEG